MTSRTVQHQLRRVLLVLATCLALFALSPGRAMAGNVGDASGNSNPNGYGATATVRFSGNAAPGGGSSSSMSVPATCWWEPMQLNILDGSSMGLVGAPNDPQALEDWFKKQLILVNGSFSFARAAYGDWSMWADAIKRIKAGEHLTLYTPKCRDGAPPCAASQFAGVVDMAGLQPGGYYGGTCGVNVAARFFTTGAAPPPMVAPADLAKIAYDNMVIDTPVVQRNPKASVDGAAGATLVLLPTWFWVTNPDSVGGRTGGTRTIRAEVGNAWAEVVAKTGGLDLASPGGGTSCSPTQALVAYGPGVGSSPCTVSFAKASVGYGAGYPVTASTSWSATWTGSGGTGGTLDPLSRQTTFSVPVAESQALVNGAR